MTNQPSDTSLTVKYFEQVFAAATGASLMQATIQRRRGKRVTLLNGCEVTEFVNCSYLGLDQDLRIIEAAQRVIAEWGVHFCCSRSRFSIEPLARLEDGLSELFGGRAITFPSVTAAHLSALPLIAGGAILGQPPPRRVCLLFDEFAHASMQALKPMLAADARIANVRHNDLDHLREQAIAAQKVGETVVYLADGVYSMGGLCPVRELVALSKELEFFLYLDDAHGTSIFGERGEGYVISQLGEDLPENVFVNFSLAKGFGCNGGGIIVPTLRQERLLRSFGRTYMFSGPLDFSITGAALVALELHHDGTVERLQRTLRERVAQFAGLPQDEDTFSPIQMVTIGPADDAIAFGRQLLDRGYFVPVTFFPIVPLNHSQLRICIAANHEPEQVLGLRKAIDEILPIGAVSL